MGFQKPDLHTARLAIGSCLVEICSPYNDGWTSQGCKKDLYQLKCWLDDEYKKLPRFPDEEQWEKELMWDRLRD